MPEVIAEIGSTHGGKLVHCLSAIDNAAEAGIRFVKFQLLEKEHIKCGNIPIDRRDLPVLVDHGRKAGIIVFASCWTKKAIRQLYYAGAIVVKFAFSADESLISYAQKYFGKAPISVLVSSDSLPCIDQVTNLFCIPHYPISIKLSFEGLFSLGRFDGFSDHTLGISQSIEAVKAGARYIEKHVIQCGDVDCPDRAFAVSWRELKELQTICREGR